MNKANQVADPQDMAQNQSFLQQRTALNDLGIPEGAGRQVFEGYSARDREEPSGCKLLQQQVSAWQIQGNWNSLEDMEKGS